MEEDEMMMMKKNNRMVAGVALVIGIFVSSTTIIQSAQAFTDGFTLKTEPKAPMAASQDGGNNVYVVWWTNKSGNWEVMFRASHDGGQTFGDKINLSNSTNGTSVVADVAAARNNVYVAYWDNKTGMERAYFRTSIDGGQTFSPEITLAAPAYGPVPPELRGQIQVQEEKRNPEMKVAVSGNNVYVIAPGDETINTPSPLEVFIRVSNDNGQTFGEPVNLSNSTGIESSRAEIEASGNNVYVSWWDKVDGRDQPMMRVSNNNGQTFGPVINLGTNGTITTTTATTGNSTTIAGEGEEAAVGGAEVAE
jgi:hypothetical protein